MAKTLVIVESPAKARTIKSFLGPGYEVMASIGHIRDLAENKNDLPKEVQKSWWADYSVDLDKDFEPIYVVPKAKQDQVKKLREAMKDATDLVLATDEDREGESISWHLLEVLKPKKGIAVRRVAFHEITRDAIQKAFANPRDLNHDLVRAQEARRVLDRLYGYTLSPVLWRLGRGRGLSAGRVQSPAVKLIVERELERRVFVSSGYWDLKASLKSAKGPFEATLAKVGSQDVAEGRDFTAEGLLKDAKKLWLKEAEAKPMAAAALAAEPWTVVSVETAPEKRNPPPPFMTSSLQQEANRKLRFSADRTMRLAQDLYEGIGATGIEGGLITYMRTDSLTLSTDALNAARKEIKNRFGEEYLPEKPRKYTSKVNNAQEAHEAIRPTSFALAPDDLAKALSGKEQQYKDHITLYDLIWKRTMACQMKPAEQNMTTMLTEVKAAGQTLTFDSRGKQILFPGFLRAYVEGSDDPEAALDDQERILPALQKGDTVKPQDVLAQGHETKPPARYTEASLVKALEALGIGRPSTYATILRTIVDREYVRTVGKELVPTFMAFFVTTVLDTNFGEFSELTFTAEMDRELDEIANGREDWKRYLREFFFGDPDTKGLKPAVDERMGNIRRPTFEVGEHEGQPIQVLFGRNGFFLTLGEGEGAATASAPEDVAPADLTVEAALEAIQKRAAGPETVGTDPVTGRALLLRNRGGYYLEAERTPEEIEKKVKPRWVSVPPGVDPRTLSAEVLEQLCLLPRDLGDGVTVKMGKYGAYVEKGIERRTLEDWNRSFSITREEAEVLLAAPKAGRGAAAKTSSALAELEGVEGAEGPVKVVSGRYGPYVTDGKTNATLPKGVDPLSLTAERAAELLNAKRGAPKTAKKRFVKRKK